MNYSLKNLALLCLTALTLFVYASVSDYDFIVLDDQGYVAKNLHVMSGLTASGVRWAFQDASLGHWHPLTWLSHMADADLYGVNPGGHHLTNLLFHLVNTLLLYYVLSRMTGLFWPSLFVAALFALHPLNVESVAWVSERKNVLSTFFWFAAMGAYTAYTEKPGLWRYAAVFTLLALGLTAKPMLVTLPLVLLLLDYWPLERFAGALFRPEEKGNGSSLQRRKMSVQLLFLEKVPLLLLSAVSIGLTLWSARAGGALESMEDRSLALRISNVLVSYGTYLFKMLWPRNLAVFYPYPASIPGWQVFFSTLALVLITAFALREARRRPYVIVGWFWYLGTLVPVIGLVQAGAQAMADRYAYVSLIGVFIMIAWFISDLPVKMRKGAPGAKLPALLIIAALAAATRVQVHYWRDSETLFSHAVSVTRDNYPAHCLLGNALLEEGKSREAMAHYRRVIEIKPRFVPAYNNMAAALQREKNFPEAVRYYRLAVQIDPGAGDAYLGLGTLLASMGRLDEAVEVYRQGIRRQPANAVLFNNLGVALTNKGELGAAVSAYRQALGLNPDYAGAHYNLAVVLQKRGDPAEASFHLREAKRLQFFGGGR